MCHVQWLGHCMEPRVLQFVEKLEWAPKLMLFREKGERQRLRFQQQ